MVRYGVTFLCLCPGEQRRIRADRSGFAPAMRIGYQRRILPVDSPPFKFKKSRQRFESLPLLTGRRNQRLLAESRITQELQP